MEQLFLSFLLGIITSGIVSKYFHNRSTVRSLTPYIQMQTDILSKIDKDIMTDLKIKFKGSKVKKLQKLQILIANTSDLPIKGITPLYLDLPKGTEVIEAEILYINPKTRDVSLKIAESGKQIAFDFSLLNKGEFFIFKLLVKGSPSPNQLRFTIAAEGLPPILTNEYMSFRQIEAKSEVDFVADKVIPIIFSFIFLMLSILLGAIAYNTEVISMFEVKYIDFPFANISLFAVMFCSLIFGFIGLICLGSVITVFREYRFKNKFIIPEELAVINHLPKELVMKSKNNS